MMAESRDELRTDLGSVTCHVMHVCIFTHSTQHSVSQTLGTLKVHEPDVEVEK